jgi:hypothetical protein
MRRLAAPGIAFVALGVILIAFGIVSSRNRAFVGIGGVFFVIGLATLARQRRAGGSR